MTLSINSYSFFSTFLSAFFDFTVLHPPSHSISLLHSMFCPSFSIFPLHSLFTFFIHSQSCSLFFHSSFLLPLFFPFFFRSSTLLSFFLSSFFSSFLLPLFFPSF